jgi:hypothetical protein
LIWNGDLGKAWLLRKQRRALWQLSDEGEKSEKGIFRVFQDITKQRNEKEKLKMHETFSYHMCTQTHT